MCSLKMSAYLLGALLTLTTMAAYVASALHSSPKLQPTSGSPSSLYIGEVLYFGTRWAISSRTTVSLCKMVRECPSPLMWKEIKSSLTPLSPVKKLVPLLQCCSRDCNYKQNHISWLFLLKKYNLNFETLYCWVSHCYM